MSEDVLSNLADFEFALACLDNDDHGKYAAEFYQRYKRTVEAFLMGRGATEVEAEEVTEDTFSKCLAPLGGNRPKLSLFNGKCALQTWLNTVALNDFLTHKRKEKPRPLEDPQKSNDEEEVVLPGGQIPPVEPERAPLLQLLRSAIDNSFQKCSAEDFVLLELAHRDEIKGKELAVMFRCDEPTISRRLKRAGQGIRKSTLDYIKSTDPYLKLVWDDFLELCRVAAPSDFEDDYEPS